MSESVVIEPYTIVKLTNKCLEFYKVIETPFGGNRKFLFIGEIKNMRGHVYVIGLDDGKNYIGYHTGDFVEVGEDEI
jgi:hypothetical protein